MFSVPCYICSFGSINIRILTAVLGMSNLLSIKNCFKGLPRIYEYNLAKCIRERVWVNLTSKQIDPYCCAVKISAGGSLVTVGHVPREISRFVYFFIRDEGGNVEGTLCQQDIIPIPAGGLEVPLKLNFSVKNL